MTGSVGRSSESRQQEVSDISRQLKGLARELNVPVVSLSQLSRAELFFWMRNSKESERLANMYIRNTE